MAEVLVRVVDKVSSDPYLDAQCTKRGDVIHVAPDGWSWGTKEIQNPDWRIVKLPNVSESDLAALLIPELHDDPQNPSRVLQRRAFKLDLDALQLDGGTSAATSTVSLVEVMAMKVRKARLSDPNVFEADEPGGVL